MQPATEAVGTVMRDLREYHADASTGGAGRSERG
jgi:hypothetical protein